jgi:hypothetical protein
MTRRRVSRSAPSFRKKSARWKGLAGGDLRSIGRSNEVVKRVLRGPRLFGLLFRQLASPDRVVRMRVADAVEKITVDRPQLLGPYKRRILALAARAEDKEFRWHMALLMARLDLRPPERAAALDILHDYLRDPSSIVKTCAMQGLADLSRDDRRLRAQVLPLVRELTRTGTPAMRARGLKLLKQLA